jgi:hypothetical protein
MLILRPPSDSYVWLLLALALIAMAYYAAAYYLMTR